MDPEQSAQDIPTDPEQSAQSAPMDVEPSAPVETEPSALVETEHSAQDDTIMASGSSAPDAATNNDEKNPEQLGESPGQPDDDLPDWERVEHEHDIP